MLGEPEASHDYMQMYGMLWRQPDSFAFVRWLFNHPKMLAERAAIIECKEAVLWEPDAATLSKLAVKGYHLTASIDDTLSVCVGRLSTSIVTKRKDWRRKAVCPRCQRNFGFDVDIIGCITICQLALKDGWR